MKIIPYSNDHKADYLGLWYRSTKIGHPCLSEEQLSEQRDALANTYLDMAWNTLRDGGALDVKKEYMNKRSVSMVRTAV